MRRATTAPCKRLSRRALGARGGRNPHGAERVGGGELTGGGDGGPNREERAGAGARHTPAEDVARCERC